MCSFNFNCIVVGKNSDGFKVKATDQIVFSYLLKSELKMMWEEFH